MSTNRLFVTKKDTFKLTVLFTKDGEMSISRVEDVIEVERPNWGSFSIDFNMPDYGTSKSIMRNSVEFEGGQSVLNMGAFNNALLLSLAKKWDLKDEKGETVPLDISKLNELRPDIARLFIQLLIEKLQKDGVYDSLLFS